MTYRDPISRRTLLKGAGALTLGASSLASLLAACGGGGSGGGAGSGKFSGQLKVWGTVSFTKAGDDLLGTQMQDWGSKNGVDVQYTAVPGTDYTTKVATALEGGGLPDIVMMQGTQTVYYASQNHLADLSDVLDKVKGQAGGMYQTLLPYVQIDGKTYAIPMESDVSVMYARLDLCQKATGKRRVPKTLDEMEQIARKVNDPPNLYGIGIPFGRSADTVGSMKNVLYADGVKVVDKDGNPAFESDAAVASMERIQRWWKDKLIPPDAPSSDDAWNNQLYQSKRGAFVFNPASIYAWLQQNDPDLLKDTDQAPIPSGRGGSFQSVSTWAWSVSAKSSNKAAAKALIQHLLQPDESEAVYEKVAGRWYPVYKGLAKRSYWSSKPYFKQFPTLIENGKVEWAPATPTAKLLTALSAVDQKYILSDLVQNVCVKGMSPKNAVHAAQQAMEQTFKESGA
jgi:multiple sugar transport system substrate-binding protein